MNNKMKILLAVSLCLNLLFIGAIIGRMTRCHDFNNDKRPDFSMMKEFRNENKELLKEIKSERKKAFEILKDENFDKAAYMTQVDVICKLQEKMFKEFASNIADKLQSMPKEQREMMIKKMTEFEKMPHKFMPKKDFKDKRGMHKGKRMYNGGKHGPRPEFGPKHGPRPEHGPVPASNFGDRAEHISAPMPMPEPLPATAE